MKQLPLYAAWGVIALLTSCATPETRSSSDEQSSAVPASAAAAQNPSSPAAPPAAEPATTPTPPPPLPVGDRSQFAVNTSSAPIADGAPIVLYTDLVSGPTSGGENNLGAYISIFGKNFGADPARVRVYLGSTEAGAYRYFGPSKGRTDIQQITVQPGNIGAGPQAIKVVVNDVESNSNLTFLPNPGTIYFVDNVDGNDRNAKKNDIRRPFRTVQTPDEDGALADVKPGDVIVLRGKAVWSDIGFENRWIRFRRTAGSEPKGIKGTGYITVQAYPNEDVHYVPSGRTSGGIHGMGENYPEVSDWIAISGLHIESTESSSSDGAPINLQANSDHWRVVNNELGPWPASADEGNKAGGLVGNGRDIKVLGNHIHDIGGGTLNHGIYFDTGTTDAEVAYNHIHHIVSGNLIQSFDNIGVANIKGLSIHHNLLHDGGRYGLNMADGTVSAHAFDNIIYNTAYAGIRFNQDKRASVSEIFEHNTLFNVCTGNRPPEPGAIQNTWKAALGSIVIRNNLVAKGSGNTCPDGYATSDEDRAISLNNNLFIGYRAVTGSLSTTITDPRSLFVAPNRADFRLQKKIAAGAVDY